MSHEDPAHSSAPHDGEPPESQEHHDPQPQTIDYIAADESAPFIALKRSQRSFVFPMAAFFIIWYAAYVLLGAYAHDFMAQPVFGSVNLGIVLGLGQFVTTFIITSVYVVYANRKLDPKAQALREEFEAQEAAS